MTKKIEMASSFTQEENNAETGSFSREELDEYALTRNISSENIALLRDLGNISQQKLETILNTKIPPRIFYLITEFGLEAGAFLVHEIDWEIVAIISNNYNYMKQLIDLDDNPKFIELLSDSEKKSLQVLANTYRISLASQYNLSKRKM